MIARDIWMADGRTIRKVLNHKNNTYIKLKGRIPA